MSEKLKRQAWWCEACDGHGYVDYPEHAGVFAVAAAIFHDHLIHAGRCAGENGAEWVRVQNEAWVTTLPS